MPLHPNQHTPTPELIWQDLEEQATNNEERLLEVTVYQADESNILLGLINQTYERTIHLYTNNIYKKSDIAFPSIEGMWIKYFTFSDHYLLAVVLEERALSYVFSEFALDLIKRVKTSESLGSLEGILHECLLQWAPIFDSRHSRQVA